MDRCGIALVEVLLLPSEYQQIFVCQGDKLLRGAVGVAVVEEDVFISLFAMATFRWIFRNFHVLFLSLIIRFWNSGNRRNFFYRKGLNSFEDPSDPQNEEIQKIIIDNNIIKKIRRIKNTKKQRKKWKNEWRKKQKTTKKTLYK